MSERFAQLVGKSHWGGAKHDYKHASSYPERKFQEALGNYFGQNDRNETANTAYMGSHCVIGNDVWIASNVVILRDVRIGNGAVVGAGAVVTKDVEPYAIVVGVPARTIKYRFNDNIIQDLESIRWWDWPMELINKHRNLLFNTKLEEKEIQALLRISEGIQKSQ